VDYTGTPSQLIRTHAKLNAIAISEETTKLKDCAGAKETGAVHAGTGFHDKVEVSSLSVLPGLWPTVKHLFVASLGTESVKPCVESEHTTFVDAVSQL
jgi:hypothetical protein